MNLIQSNYPIYEDISTKGFSLVPAKEMNFHQKLYHSLNLFIKSWENLPLDNYMEDKGKYRVRRYGRFTFDPSDKSLELQPEITYFQGKKYNSLNGNVERKFSPLEKITVNNHFLRELILFNFKQLPNTKNLHQGYWNTGVHQIRVKAEQGIHGKPTPEGIHKDGEMFTIQHLIKRENVTGGISSVYDNNKNKINEWEQQNIFDSFYFKDSEIYHAVSPIKPKDNVNSGLRDILLIDFDPIKNQK